MLESVPGHPPRSRDYDGLLSLGAIAVATLCALLLRDASLDLRGTPREESAAVAKLTFVASEVRRRPAGSLVWYTLRPGDPVFEMDSIFVPPQASASFTLLHGGARLEVEENSLVVLEPPATATSSAARGARVALRKGSVSGTSGEQGLLIRGAGGVTELARGAAARVDLQGPDTARVEALAGEAIVHTLTGDKQALPPGTAGALGSGGTLSALRPFTVVLEAPPRDQRLYFSGRPPPVELRWTADKPEGLRVELARDRLFRDVRDSFSAAGGSRTLTLQEGGVYWWRVVDAGGTPQSEARKLSLVEALAPAPISPRAGERFSSRSIPFAWAATPAAVAYRVEVAADPELRNVLHVRELDLTQLWWKEDVPEGTYYWRVCARVLEQDVRSCSAVGSFVLLAKPLPAAPVLLKPEIEVEHGSRRRP